MKTVGKLELVNKDKTAIKINLRVDGQRISKYKTVTQMNFDDLIILSNQGFK